MSANTPEGKVKKAIREILDKYKPDVWYFMPSSRAFGKAGVPDLVCCVRGIFVGIEAKAGKGRLSVLQKATLEQICAAGGYTYVVYENGVEQLDETIGEMVRNSKDAES